MASHRQLPWRVAGHLTLFISMLFAPFPGCSGPAAPKLTPEEEAANKANDALFNGEFDNAIEDFSRAIELNGQKADYYLNRGIAYCGQKHYEDAIKDLDKAIELDGTLSAAFHHRSLAHAALGHSDQAEKDALEAKRLAPGS